MRILHCPKCMSEARLITNADASGHAVFCTSKFCGYSGQAMKAAQDAVDTWNESPGRGRPRVPSRTLDDVIEMMSERERLGLRKYGTTVDRNDFSTATWVRMALEESMDMSLYLMRLLRELEAGAEE